MTDLVRAARAKRIGSGPDVSADVAAFLAKRFSAGQTRSIMDAHMAEEGRPIETLWDAATGITAFAKLIPFQADRVEMEREGGRVLEMAR